MSEHFTAIIRELTKIPEADQACYGRLAEMKESRKSLPRFLLMENVPTLLSKRHFENFSTWIAELESLG